ncbi:Neuraminidase (sialidase) [Streptosporangium album]|uniref:Neuraminidase (Sialidase) n=1 Tax=Streptosporangium album TaxID=47479 RepID=A0A7W7RTE1_9ACTN|nr:hypothetical protein [Streptosporangium album]MBB4937879.1 Neuraminidase (sialidase) [Streptosporangium album]
MSAACDQSWEQTGGAGEIDTAVTAYLVILSMVGGLGLLAVVMLWGRRQ